MPDIFLYHGAASPKDITLRVLTQAQCAFAQYDWPLTPAQQSWSPWSQQQNLLLTTLAPPAVPGLPPGEQIYDLSPRDHARSQDLRTWAWNYNLNLIGKDKMLVGEQVTDLPPKSVNPLVDLRPNNLGTWLWNYNLNLIGKDAMIVGEQVTDLPPRDYQRPQDLRTWTWNYNLNLIGQDAMVAGKQVTDLPPRAHPEPATRTWLWQYNPNLVGKDQLPNRQTDWPPAPAPAFPVNLRTWIGLPVPAGVTSPFNQLDWPLPRAYPEPATRTWVWNYNLNLIGQDKLPVGETIYDLPPRDYAQPAKTWTWSYNLNLIGQDLLPTGEQVTDLPPRAYPEPATRTWLVNLSLTTLNTPVGKSIYDLPPRDYAQPAKTWTWNYNLNLIGQDKLPVGAIVTDLPPRDYSRILQTWIAPLNLSLITVVQPLPFNQYTWPTPQPLTQPDRGFTAFYNPNLIAQDQLPVGTRLTDLPPRDFQRTLQTWVANVSQALTAQAQPFNQLDWRNPQPLGQPDRSFVAFYNPNLVGQDALPVGARVTDLPPRDYPPPATRTWTFSYSLDLIGQDKFPPGARLFDLAPVGPPHPTQNRTWTWAYNQNLIGQDSFPPGARLSDLPPRDHVRLLQTWVQAVNLALIAPAAPFSQFDWPLPQPLTQPDRSFVATFPLTLIGQDRLPFRQQDWPLPTIAAQPDRGFSATYNRNLIGKDQLPPGGIITALPPVGYEYPANLRFFSQSPAVPPPTPVVGVALYAPHFFSTMGMSIGSPANPPS